MSSKAGIGIDILYLLTGTIGCQKIRIAALLRSIRSQSPVCRAARVEQMKVGVRWTTSAAGQCLLWLEQPHRRP